MPIFEFRCNPCNKIYEVLKLDSTEPHFCEGCGEQCEAVFSLPARVTPSTYGKGGGRGQVSNDAHASQPTPRP